MIQALANTTVSSPEGVKAPFVQILQEIVEDKSISPGAFRLYTLLIAFSRNFGSCWPSQATLANRLNVGSRTIHNWIKELEAADYIEIEHRCYIPGQEQSNIYRLKRLVPRQGQAQTERILPEITAPVRPKFVAPPPPVEICNPPCKDLQPPPEKVCNPPLKNFSDESHVLIHESIFKHTSYKESEAATDEKIPSVCVTPQSEKRVEKEEPIKPKTRDNLQEQAKVDDSGIKLNSSGSISPRIESPAPAPKNDISPEKVAQAARLGAELEVYGVSTERAKSLARKLLVAGKDTAYVEAWASWIIQQPTTRNVAAYLVRMLEQIAPLPVSGQPASITPKAPPPVSQSDAKFLPQWIEIEERNMREARSDHDLQTAQERLNRYRAMETQLKAQMQALEPLAPVPAANPSVSLVSQNPATVVSQLVSPTPQTLPPVDPADAKYLPQWIAMEERNLREARCERDRQTAQMKLNRYLAMEAQLSATNLSFRKE